jgi:hypothetical protein
MPHDGTQRSTETPLCVLLCRDCCCGTLRKHPDVDHAAQERAFRDAAAESGGRVIRTRCLGVCERSNVVVLKTAHTTYWLAGVLSPEDTACVTTFIRSGGRARLPRELTFHEVPRNDVREPAYPCRFEPVRLPV